ncbi:MAG: pilus assembly PilX N-terminal domain-containing protein [Sulfuritalea sp.]|nr:pilus assembly PilX N-terminal domain-containing protein [Sulfuritalea sp.]
MRAARKQPRGFAIVTAIFVLIVLSALGAFIVNISTSQQLGSALDVQGVRAYQTARAGIEWGLHQVQATAAYNFGYTSTDPDTRACPAAITSFTTAAPTLGDFTVTVECTATPDADDGPTVYAITATACNQPVAGWTAGTVACPNTVSLHPLYVERRLSVEF